MIAKFENVHSEKYAAAIDAAKKFVAKSELRPILRMVHHRSDGSIVATDSRAMLLVKGVHGFKEEYLVNPRTLEFATGLFPDTDKILPREKDPVFSVNQLQMATWIQFHKSFKQLKLNFVTAHFDKDAVKIELSLPDNSATVNLPMKDYNPHNSDCAKITFNPAYMLESLLAMQMLNSKTVEFKFYGQYSPFVLDNGTDVICLILPARKY